MTTAGFGNEPFGTSPFGLGTTGVSPSTPPPPLPVLPDIGDLFEPPRHRWTVFSRNSAYDESVPLPILSLSGVKRHVAVGRAVLTTSFTRERWDAMQPGSGIIAYRDGRVEFSGSLTSPSQIMDEGDGRLTIQAEYASDEDELQGRIVFPDPLRAPDAQTVNDYWTYTGTASAAMRQLISDQAGPTCHAGRRIPGLVLGPDPNVGVSRSWSGLFTSDGTVLEKLAALSLASGADLGVRVVGAAGSLMASVVEPRDVSETMKFSAGLKNLRGYSLRLAAPTVTHVVVAGQGDLAQRVRRYAATSDPLALEWNRQRWAYVDRRDTSDLAELDQAAQDTLAEGGQSIELAVTLTDSQAATYGKDWGLGDRIRIFVGPAGQPEIADVTDVVREIAFEVTPAGEKLTPAVGTADATALPSSPTQQQLRAVGLRLSALESNK